jgi:cytochrome c oxidase cbb3-type subunit 3
MVARKAPIFVGLVGVFGVALMGCDRAPSDATAREWTPHDHDHADEKGKVLSGNSTGPRAPRGSKRDGGDARDEAIALIELTWQKQCSTCHGPEGRGDGPQGAMFKAQDLTSAGWQATVTDDQMASSIANGKGGMPKFNLPPEMIRGLIARIRASATPER